MNRGELRKYLRTLADELGEAPEGLFTNADGDGSGLNTLINLSQQNVYLALIHHIPWYLRDVTTFTMTATDGEYSISSDMSISDFFMFEMIIKNTSGERPDPLIWLETPEEINDFLREVGDTDEPRAYYISGQGDTINFLPPPDSAYPYNIFYFPEIPDLNHDSSDASPNVATPHLPKVSHPLIALDVLKDWHIRSEEEKADIEDRYNSILFNVSYVMSAKQGLRSGRGRNIKEVLGKAET